MTVEQWKNNGCDYFAGVAVYAAYPSHNKNLLRLFTRKHTPQTEAKLRYELSKIPTEKRKPAKSTAKKKTVTAELVAKTAVKNNAPPPPKSNETNAPVYMGDLPKELRPVLEKAHAHFKRACRLKIDLNELPAAATKKAFAIQMQIDDAMNQNRVCWEMIDFYNDYGYLPQQKNEFKDMTPAQLYQRRRSKIEAVSKYNREIDTLQDQIKEEADLHKKKKLTWKLESSKKLKLKHESELVQLNELINEH